MTDLPALNIVIICRLQISMKLLIVQYALYNVQLYDENIFFLITSMVVSQHYGGDSTVAFSCLQNITMWITLPIKRKILGFRA